MLSAAPIHVPTPPNPEAQRYRRVPHRQYSTTNGNCLIEVLSTRERICVAGDLASVLRELEPFSLLPDHAISLARSHRVSALRRAIFRLRKLPLLPALLSSLAVALLGLEDEWWSNNARTIYYLRRLATLRALGLLVSEEQLQAGCRATCMSSQVALAITDIVIPTAHRPLCLGRCLLSLSEYLKRFGRRARITIADGSQPQECKTDKDLVERHGRDSGLEIRHLGYEEKKALAVTLMNHGCDPRSVNFCLFGGSSEAERHGCNRNALLLATAGATTLSCDDDVVWMSPDNDITYSEAECSASFTQKDPFLYKVVPNAQDFKSALCPDVLALHERWLGARLSDTFASGKIQIQNLCDHAVTDSSDGRGLVRMVAGGSCGDSGMYSGSAIMLSTNEAVRSQLRADDRYYQLAAVSRAMLKCVSAPRMSHGLHPTAMIFSYVNDAPVLPYCPIGKNEDGVFAYLARICFPHQYSVALDVELMHTPPGNRANNPHWTVAMSRNRISDVIIALSALCIGQREIITTDVLGVFLSSLAKLSCKSFVAIVSEALNMRLMARLALMEHAIAGAPATSAWRMAMIASMAHQASAATKPEFSVPIDLADDPCCAQTQNVVANYGMLLLEWPAIWNAALNLRKECVTAS